MNNQLQASPVRTAIEIAVNLLLIFIILAWCLQILRPFISFIVWGAVIAIAMYKPFLKLQSAVGGRKKLAVALFAILGLAVVLVPAWMFAGSILDTTTEVKTVLESGDVNIQPPNESVKEWPVIGEKLHAQWSAAAVNFGDWIEANSEFIKTVTNKLFSKVAEIGLGVLQFVLSTLIAAAFLANAETIGEGMNRLFRRLVGDRAEGMLMLTTSTVQSVTVGVLGIAFIQAFLGGLGMVVAGVPAAGVWALLILILGIAQLPPLLILIPAMIYVFSVESTTVAVIFMIWSLLVSFSDMVLKPLLLGRGVEAPMLVILLGAIGGMIMSGIIGLFVGAVVLAIGYVLLQSWLELGEPEGGDASDPA
jgi:predicted PurR-regulated permease PerM